MINYDDSMIEWESIFPVLVCLFRSCKVIYGLLRSSLQNKIGPATSKLKSALKSDRGPRIYGICPLRNSKGLTIRGFSSQVGLVLDCAKVLR